MWCAAFFKPPQASQEMTGPLIVMLALLVIGLCAGSARGVARSEQPQPPHAAVPEAEGPQHAEEVESVPRPHPLPAPAMGQAEGQPHAEGQPQPHDIPPVQPFDFDLTLTYDVLLLDRENRSWCTKMAMVLSHDSQVACASSHGRLHDGERTGSLHAMA